MFKKLKITCDEATMICDKNQYGAATLFNKIKLNFHVIICKACALYIRQNRALTKIYKRHSKEYKAVKHFLSLEEKEALKVALEKYKNS